MEIGNDSASIPQVASEWYALNPDIRRLWVYEAREPYVHDKRDVHVIVALRPVCDSDDIGPIWLAKSADWQRELQRLIGRRVHLDWFDGDVGSVLCAEDPERARAGLTSIAWRHIE